MGLLDFVRFQYPEKLKHFTAMKKLCSVVLLALIACITVDAQILRADELENYAKEKYGEKWVDAATNLGSQLTSDKNNAITYTQVIPAEGKTKEQLYVLLNYGFTATFNDANSVIKLNDKELGPLHKACRSAFQQEDHLPCVF